MFITNAGTEISGVVTITARTGEDEISNLVVENGTPGYELSPPLHKMGWRSSDTRGLTFAGCRVPEGHLLGPRGKRLPPVPRDPRRRPDQRRGARPRRGPGRVRDVASLRQRARAVRPPDRDVPGGRVQAGRHGDRDRGRPAAWSTRRRGSRTQGRDFAQMAAMAKLYTGELSRRVCNEAVQIHGGYGFMDEYPVSRFYRDQKVLEIGEGTNEVQRHGDRPRPGSVSHRPALDGRRRRARHAPSFLATIVSRALPPGGRAAADRGDGADPRASRRRRWRCSRPICTTGCGRRRR